MPVIPFDTNEHVRQLEAAHATRELAEAIVHVVVAAQTGADFATKADIAELRADIEALRLAAKADLEALRGELRTEIRDARIDTIKWFAGLLLAQAGLITALVKLL